MNKFFQIKHNLNIHKQIKNIQKLKAQKAYRIQLKTLINRGKSIRNISKFQD